MSRIAFMVAGVAVLGTVACRRTFRGDLEEVCFAAERAGVPPGASNVEAVLAVTAYLNTKIQTERKNWRGETELTEIGEFFQALGAARHEDKPKVWETALQETGLERCPAREGWATKRP